MKYCEYFPFTGCLQNVYKNVTDTRAGALDKSAPGDYDEKKQISTLTRRVLTIWEMSA